MLSLFNNPRTMAKWCLWLMLPLPSVGVFFAMALPATRGTPLGQSAYFLAKLLFLGIPIAYWWFKRPALDRYIPIQKPHVFAGLGWGVLFVLVIWIALAIAIYAGFEVGSIKQATQKNGLDTVPKFLLLAAYLSFVNSFAEEFIWRDFLYQQWRHFLSPKSALCLTNGAFGVHHFFALVVQTHWQLALLATTGVIIAGCIWSWLYLTYKSIWPAYISHIFADLAIFGAVGWLLFT